MFHGSKSDGFSLVEALVAMAIMSIVGVATMNMISQQMNQVGYLEGKLGQSRLTQDLLLLLASPTLCKAALKTETYQASNPELEFDLGGGRVVKAGADMTRTDGLKVDHLTLENTQLINAGAEVLGDLILRVTTSKGLSLPLANAHVGKIYLVLDSNQKIIGCMSGGANNVNFSAKIEATPGRGMFQDLGSHNFCAISTSEPYTTGRGKFSDNDTPACIVAFNHEGVTGWKLYAITNTGDTETGIRCQAVCMGGSAITGAVSPSFYRTRGTYPPNIDSH